MRQKLANLQNEILKEYESAEKAYFLAKDSAQEIAASAAASPSQSGDRFHSQGAADLAKERYEVAQALKAELELAVGKEIPDLVEVSCYVKTDKLELYLVSNPLMITGFKLVSVNSPIAEKIIGKGVGEKMDDLIILEIG